MTSPEDLFPGRARPLPAPVPQGSGFSSVFLEADDGDPVDVAAPEAAVLASGVPAVGTATEPARRSPLLHASGYAAFGDHLRSRGLDPVALAGDLASLVSTLASSSVALADDAGLRASAAVFLGNTIIAQRPDLRWQVVSSPEVGNDRQWLVVEAAVDHLLQGDPDGARHVVEMVATWPNDADRPKEVYSEPVDFGDAVAPYARPAIDFPAIRDETGTVIPYGARWPAGAPPEDSYSVESHLERFAPLHPVARALVDYLEREFDVTVSRDPAHADDLMFPPDAEGQVDDAIRVTPADSQAAPLTFVLTSFPGVRLHAGELHDFTYPDCGCDACDETAAASADELERTVLAIVAGGYVEAYRSGADPWTTYTLSFGEDVGRSAGSGPADDRLARRSERAEARLSALPGRWAPWTPHSR